MLVSVDEETPSSLSAGQVATGSVKLQQLTLSLGVLSSRVNRLQLSSDKLSKHLHTCERCNMIIVDH